MRQDYLRMEEDYASQQQISSDIRLEASHLLDEIKNLQLLNDALQMKTDTKKETRAISPVHVTEYEKAVDELLKSTRSDTCTSVLVAMKAIVVSCKIITEESESFDYSQGELQELDRLKVQLSNALTEVMSAARLHATGAKQTAIESCADALNTVMVCFYFIFLYFSFISTVVHCVPFGQWDTCPYCSGCAI